MGLQDRLKAFRDKRARGERGAGLITVLGLSLIITTMITTMTASTSYLSKTTYEKLGDQQSDALSEFALNVAVSNYVSGNCVVYKGLDEDADGTVTNPKAPDGQSYSYGVYSSKEATLPDMNNITNANGVIPGFNGGCPTASDKWMVIQTQAKAKDGATTTKYAAYRVPGAGERLPNAITASSATFTNTDKDNYVSTLRNSVGNVSSIPIISLNGGKFSCSVGNNHINANILSNSTTKSTISNDCTVNGDVVSGKGGFEVTGTGSINGDYCTTGTNYPGTGVRGKVSTTNCLTVPTARYGYIPSATGTNICASPITLASLNTTLSAESNKGKTVILDLTKCTVANLKAVLSPASPDTLSVYGDVTLLLPNGTSVENLTFKNADNNTSSSNLNFVVPAKSANATVAECAVSGKKSNFVNVNYSSGASGVIYDVCGVDIQKSIINGQLYSADSVTLTDSTLNYSPVVLPNGKVSIGKNALTDLVRVF